jgi:hypothetical protein
MKLVHVRISSTKKTQSLIEKLEKVSIVKNDDDYIIPVDTFRRFEPDLDRLGKTISAQCLLIDSTEAEAELQRRLEQGLIDVKKAKKMMRSWLKSSLKEMKAVGPLVSADDEDKWMKMKRDVYRLDESRLR